MAHSHHQHHHAGAYDRAFAWGVALNMGFVVLEVAAGLWSGSLALMADAGHNLSDVLGLLLAWAAARLSRLSPTARRTYGWRSTTILAALINAAIVMIAVGAICLEAVRRLGHPASVAGNVIIITAALGVVINTATALFFFAGRKTDLNIRGAFLHMAADAGVSGGVVLAGLLIRLTGQAWLDPAVSLGIAVVILVNAWGLFRDAADLILQAVPAGLDSGAVRSFLESLPGVNEVHDLHIWALSTRETALTAHLVKPDSEGDDELIVRAGFELRERFGISHTTLQWERGDPHPGKARGCDEGGENGDG